MDINSIKKMLDNFPKVNLGINPTPLNRLYNLEKSIDSKIDIYIKRDDLNGLGAGGNKVRNLEYLIGDAISKKSDTIIASGKIQSNLCSLAAAACKKTNLDCIIVHNDDAPEKITGNGVLNKILGVDIRYIGDVNEITRGEYVANLKKDLIEQGRKPYVILNGASTALGSLGYVEAMMELYEQCTKNNIDIKNLYVPGGNGGLAAGVIFGSAIIDSPFIIHVITVEHEKDKLRQILMYLIKEIEELTGIVFNKDFDSIVKIHDQYRGGGWGMPTDEAVKQIYDFAQIEGIFIEKVYTSKTLYGMIDMVKKGEVNDNVCYLHSGGFGTVFSQF